MWTYIILAAIIAYCIFVIIRHINGKKNGITSCGTSCGGCSSASICNKDLYKEFMKDHTDAA